MDLVLQILSPIEMPQAATACIMQEDATCIQLLKTDPNASRDSWIGAVGGLLGAVVGMLGML